MGMTRGTALVASVAEVVSLTGQTTLLNLEVGDELDLDALLITASDTIYDRIEADGTDPTTLSNESVFRRTIAWHFLALLAALGHFSAGEGERSQEFFDRFMGLSDRYYEQVKSKVSTGDAPGRRANEAAPAVANLTRKGLFDTTNTTAGEAWDDTPRRR